MTVKRPIGEGASVDIQLNQCVGVEVLRVAGDLRLWGRPEEKKRFTGTLQSGLLGVRTQLVLSLGGLKFVDTMGIAMLVDLLKKCLAQEIIIRVVLPVGITGQALRVIRIFERYQEFPDEQAALRAAEKDTTPGALPGTFEPSRDPFC